VANVLGDAVAAVYVARKEQEAIEYAKELALS